MRKDIEEANTAVKGVTKKKARDKYGDYIPEERARIGKQELPTRSYTRGSLTVLTLNSAQSDTCNKGCGQLIVLIHQI